MEDFERIVIGDVTVEKVNLTRATYKEAAELKNILKVDIARRFKKIVVDLSQCEFIDSTFIGVLVLALKDITRIDGKLCLVNSSSIAHTILVQSGTLRIFNVSNTIEEAINSFESSIK